MNTTDRDITDKSDKRNTGWFSTIQAKEKGAHIHKSLRNGYPVMVSCIQVEKPDFPDVKSCGPVGGLIKNSAIYPTPLPDHESYSDGFGKLFGRKLDPYMDINKWSKYAATVFGEQLGGGGTHDDDEIYPYPAADPAANQLIRGIRR